MKFISKSQKETKSFAKDLAQKIEKATVVALYGDLGAGKTNFVQGFADGLGVKNRIISPTFVILKSYKGKNFNFHHIDLYRLNSEKEIIDQGILDLFNDKENIVAVEWAEKIDKLLPKDSLKIKLNYISENEREIEINDSR